ncbi:hypothetical protein [Methanomethylovorans sp.]|uniref:hypothetical protein n=1 Tax=Methanomethylovorans sp. TaxID=2758717 RepID=UPI00351C62B8
MNSDKMKNNTIKIFALLVSLLYMVFGAIHIAEGLGIDTGLTAALFVSADILGGFSLLVIGTVFFYGFRELNAGLNEGLSFVYVGMIISLVFMLVYILVGAGTLLDSFLLPEDYVEWHIVDQLRPGIYLGIPVLAAFLTWRNRFTTIKL